MLSSQHPPPSSAPKHFNEYDFTMAKTDTPGIFKKERLRKGAVPSVNLRGGKTDERELKRSG